MVNPEDEAERWFQAAISFVRHFNTLVLEFSGRIIDLETMNENPAVIQEMAAIQNELDRETFERIEGRRVTAFDRDSYAKRLKEVERWIARELGGRSERRR